MTDQPTERTETNTTPSHKRQVTHHGQPVNTGSNGIFVDFVLGVVQRVGYGRHKKNTWFTATFWAPKTTIRMSLSRG